MSHTKGPWNCIRASAGGREIITSDVSPVDVCVLSRSNKSPEEINANALLIAAAPELLEALEELYHLIDDAHDGDRVFTLELAQKAKAAIAKARGQG